jgi:hypothetical protein
VTAHRLAARQTGELDGIARGGPGSDQAFYPGTIAHTHVYLRRGGHASSQLIVPGQRNKGEKIRPGLAGSEGLSRSLSSRERIGKPCEEGLGNVDISAGGLAVPPCCVQTHNQPQLSKKIRLIPNSLGCLEPARV